MNTTHYEVYNTRTGKKVREASEFEAKKAELSPTGIATTRHDGEECYIVPRSR